MHDIWYVTLVKKSFWPYRSHKSQIRNQLSNGIRMHVFSAYDVLWMVVQGSGADHYSNNYEIGEILSDSRQLSISRDNFWLLKLEKGNNWSLGSKKKAHFHVLSSVYVCIQHIIMLVKVLPVPELICLCMRLFKLSLSPFIHILNTSKSKLEASYYLNEEILKIHLLF